MNTEKLLKELKVISKSLEQLQGSLNNIIRIIQEDITRNSADERHLSDSTDEDNLETSASEIFGKFFLERRCEIVNYSEEFDNKVLQNISNFIGNKYIYLREFLKELKKSLNTGKTIRLFLKDANQNEISYICQLAKNLHDIAFLENYVYMNAPKYILYADPIREPEVIKFLNGHWLEIYIMNKIKEMLTENGLTENKDFFYMYNVQIRLPNGNYSELDILFKILDSYYWIEVKTGDYQRYVHKYADLVKLFNLPRDNMFIVITEITDAGAEAVTDLFKMTVTNLNTFEEKFLSSLEKMGIA
ncbi:hypothetical protein [Persephonella sp.]